MPMQQVTFQFLTGLKRSLFRNARLSGSWDGNGRYSESWTQSPMAEVVGEDGCPVFEATVSLDIADQGKTFRWGVLLDGPQGANFWGIPTEVQDANSADRYRLFQLQSVGAAPQVERYYFTYCRRLGANKYGAPGSAAPGLRFAVWAPNAHQVDVVFGQVARGYIDDAGGGINPALPAVSLTRRDDSIWDGAPTVDFADYMALPYMYRIENAQGQFVYRTDIFSRHQVGEGDINPAVTAWPGTVATLDGTVGCSAVIDPDLVRRGFDSTPPGATPDLISTDEFWASEFTAGLPVPTSVDDLVIYELHVGSLGFDKAGPGDLGDAMNFLDHLRDLGVNAVELLPMAEFAGNMSWGYGDTHYFCIESSAGGRDKFRHFVRECHRRGIAVLQDVVYNHYDPAAERAQWQYDSTAPEQNLYYWYEGLPTQYSFSAGGYLDNGSSGYSPRFWEEVVRQQFISSAAFLIEEMHVDGLRVDLTQAIHRDNKLHADGREIGSANLFGQKFLREWSRTLNMIRPTVMLIAEDHTGWDAVTKPPAQGGLGFDATWQASLYHDLIGDSDLGAGHARLLKQAGIGGNEPLAIDTFSSNLYNTRLQHVVYHESHDEAGNAAGSARTLVVAVNHAPLIDSTRTVAENRSRVCFGLSLLSAGAPMFFMGEEIGAQKRYTFDHFISQREDILGERLGNGARLFRYYQEIIGLSGRLRSIRSHNIDVLHQSNGNRVIAFKRWIDSEEVIIVASLNNTAFRDGYAIRKDSVAIPDARWKEVFNSDSSFYGGGNVGNGSATIVSGGAQIRLVIPANGMVVLVRQ